MMKYIHTMLLALAGLAVMAQTNEPLPGDAEPLTNQLYLSPSDSTVWAADPFSGLAIKVGTWFKVDSLFKEGYTKVQVDSAITANIPDLSGFYTKPESDGRFMALRAGLGGTMAGTSYNIDFNEVNESAIIRTSSLSSNAPSSSAGFHLQTNYQGATASQTAIGVIGSGAGTDDFYYRGRLTDPWNRVASRNWVDNNYLLSGGFAGTGQDLKDDIDGVSAQSVDYFQRAIDLYDTNKISFDGTTENANELSANTDSDGNVYLGKVTSKRDLVIVKFTPAGKKIERKIGDMCSSLYEMDSHTSPIILLDERAGAEYPLIVIQSNHSSSGCGMGIRMWRLDSKDIGTAIIPEPVQLPNTVSTTYPQFYRHGDQIFGFARQTTGNNNVWAAYYSSDNGDSWVGRNLFSAGSQTNWLYMFSNQIHGEPVINIAFNDHIDHGINHSIRYYKLDMETGVLTNLSTNITTDYPDFIANSGTFVNPYVTGLVLYTPVGGETTNRIRVSQNATGNLIGIFQRQDARILMGVEFDRNNGTIYNTFEIDSVPEDTEFTEFVNYAEDGNVYAFKWKFLFGEEFIDIGNSSIIKYDITDQNNIVQDTVLAGNYKIHRPRKLPNGNGFTFCEMLFDRGYSLWKSNIILHKFDDFVTENDDGESVVLQSPDGTRWRIRVDNTGTIQVDEQ